MRQNEYLKYIKASHLYTKEFEKVINNKTRPTVEQRKKLDHLRYTVYITANKFAGELIQSIYEDSGYSKSKNPDDVLFYCDKQFQYGSDSDLFILKEINDIEIEPNRVYYDFKPNFAILMAVMINISTYVTRFGAKFMEYLFSIFEQNGFTGLFGYKREEKGRKIQQGAANKLADNINIAEKYPLLMAALIRYNYPKLKTESGHIHTITNSYTSILFRSYTKYDKNQPYNLKQKQSLTYLQQFYDTDVLFKRLDRLNSGHYSHNQSHSRHYSHSPSRSRSRSRSYSRDLDHSPSPSSSPSPSHSGHLTQHHGRRIDSLHADYPRAAAFAAFDERVKRLLAPARPAHALAQAALEVSDTRAHPPQVRFLNVEQPWRDDAQDAAARGWHASGPLQTPPARPARARVRAALEVSDTRAHPPQPWHDDAQDAAARGWGASPSDARARPPQPWRDDPQDAAARGWWASGPSQTTRRAAGGRHSLKKYRKPRKSRKPTNHKQNRKSRKRTNRTKHKV